MIVLSSTPLFIFSILHLRALPLIVLIWIDLPYHYRGANPFLKFIIFSIPKVSAAFFSYPRQFVFRTKPSLNHARTVEFLVLEDIIKLRKMEFSIYSEKR
ncbi:hypothetical protein M5689_012795 [Euphorbia peplus]|nr:hypothetical protein M5689_012795 [Euphorbia peplus]